MTIGQGPNPFPSRLEEEIHKSLLRMHVEKILHFDIKPQDSRSLGFEQLLTPEDKRVIAFLHVLSEKYCISFKDEYRKLSQTKAGEKKTEPPKYDFLKILNVISPTYNDQRAPVLMEIIPKILTGEKYKPLRESILQELQMIFDEIRLEFKDDTPLMKARAEQEYGINELKTDNILKRLSDPEYLQSLMKLYLNIIHPQELK